MTTSTFDRRGLKAMIQHRADQVAEALAGSTCVTTVELSAQLPTVTLVFKLGEETVHVLDLEFGGAISGAVDA